MKLLYKILIGLSTLITCLPQETIGLRALGLSIDPSAVRRGSHATLRCIYELRGAPLYSVKWYRGRHEFYRYSPSELPANKIFPFPGIHVDLSLSNASQVVLRKVGFNLAGNFSCEVTADAPSFSTATVTNHMLVVELPNSPPVLMAERDRYDPGDILQANCTTPPSKPAASITFLLNNIPVGDDETFLHPAEDSLQWAFRSLTVRLLPSHYSGGRLVLRCSAEVIVAPPGRWGLTLSGIGGPGTGTVGNAALYSDSAEIPLSPARDPRPERVTYPNGADKQKSAMMTILGALLSTILFTR